MLVSETIQQLQHLIPEQGNTVPVRDVDVLPKQGLPVGGSSRSVFRQSFDLAWRKMKKVESASLISHQLRKARSRPADALQRQQEDDHRI